MVDYIDHKIAHGLCMVDYIDHKIAHGLCTHTNYVRVYKIERLVMRISHRIQQHSEYPLLYRLYIMDVSLHSPKSCRSYRETDSAPKTPPQPIRPSWSSSSDEGRLEESVLSSPMTDVSFDIINTGSYNNTRSTVYMESRRPASRHLRNSRDSPNSSHNGFARQSHDYARQSHDYARKGDSSSHILPPRMAEEDICIEHINGVDVLVYDPYNPVNREITQSVVQDLLATYGIQTPIHNFNLYRRAFVHRSYTKSPIAENALNNITISPKPDNCIPLSTKSNERLEFIGDGVLECITKYYLYCRFPKENEGFMTEKKIALVKNEAIGRIALEMGLHRWFILSRHTEEKMTRTNIKKLGCLFESFLGALFLDCNKVTESDDADAVVGSGDLCQHGFMCGPGFQFAQIFITHVFDKHIDWVELIQTDDNFKNILQVKIQKEFKNTPEYLHIHPYNNEDGYHMGVYICLGQPIHAWHRGHADSVHISQFPTYQSIHEYVHIRGSVLVFLGEGTHKIKKKAEQIACEMGSTALERCKMN